MDGRSRAYFEVLLRVEAAQGAGAKVAHWLGCSTGWRHMPFWWCWRASGRASGRVLRLSCGSTSGVASATTCGL